MVTSLWRQPLLLLLALVISLTEGYRLDQPRLLLPYSPTTSLRTELHVSDPVGGCFHWESTRAQDVEVVPIGSGSRGCSDRAEVRTTSKLTGNVSAMIYAIDRTTNTRLSCDVRVDYIASIEILTTTSVIYVDAVPVKMETLARNARGSAFTSLGSLPLEWEFSNNDALEGERPVRVVPFTDSEWEGAPEIVALERDGKRGHSVLVEGLVVGSTLLTARLADPYFAEIRPHSMEVVVVANLQLLPSYTLYVPVHAVVPFAVEIIRQQKSSRVTMPSPQYFLKVDEPSIAVLDVDATAVTALKKGRAEVSLLSKNVNAKLQGVSPPATTINVVDPETLRFAVSGGNNWLLEKGRRYAISISMFDARDNSMYISDLARFETVLPAEFFDIHKQSDNGTWFDVTAKQTGRPTLSSRFHSIILPSGQKVSISGRIHGEQVAEIVDPLVITPPTIVLPFLPSKRVEAQLTVTGGSGSVEWSTENSGVAGVDASTGLLRAAALGSTKVRATDRRNRAHEAEAKIHVVEVSQVEMGRTRVEVLEGHTLWINVQLVGVDPKGERIVITDCRTADLRVESSDDRVALLDTRSPRRLPTEGTGCVSLPLKAGISGDAKITITLNEHSTTQHVSVYPALSSSFRDSILMLGVGSGYGVDVKGGPRPWILDPSRAFQKASTSGTTKAAASFHDGSAQIKCDSATGEAEVVIRVGNSATPSNPLPAVEELKMRMCCATPSRAVINTQREEVEGEGEGKRGGEGLAKGTCPTHTRAVFVTSTMRLVLAGYGRCDGKGEERALHSISAMKVKWSTDKADLLKLTKDDKDNALALAQPQGKTGTVGVVAECSGGLSARVDLTLFDKATATPPSLVLWNDPAAKTQVKLKGGSGHFTVRAAAKDGAFEADLVPGGVWVTPRSVGTGTVRVYDSCIDYVIEVKVKVTDVQHVGIIAPDYVEVGRRVPVHLRAVDDAGAEFSSEVARLMDLTLVATGNLVQLEKISSDHYEMVALAVGSVSLSATGRSSRSSSTQLTSTPHSVQIFSPILLFPKIVTLIPESNFQLEVVGGPRPTPPIAFSLNDTRIAALQPNALIRSSTTLGYASVTGIVEFGNGLESKDTVVVRVVSLRGVRIVVTASEVETGTRILARLEGIDTDEAPFAFGGADYPLKITWSLNDTAVFRVTSPFGDAVREPLLNRYSLWLEAGEAGLSTLSVRVEEHPGSKKHFTAKGTTYHYSTDLRSVSPLSLTMPPIETGEILLAPGGSMQLSSNWPSSTVSYRVPLDASSLLSVSPRGMLTSLGPVGTAAVEIVREGRSILSSVQIVNPSSIDVRVSPQLTPASGSALNSLPLGATVRLKVVLRDRLGRVIHASGPSSNIVYRPHRFDLTTITGRDANRTLTVRLVSVGETVLKIWDPSSPSLQTYVRLSCGDALAPSASALVTSDVICLRSPLGGGVDDEASTTWSSDDARVIRVVDQVSGVFKAAAPGSTLVHLSHGGPSKDSHQRLYTVMAVSAPSVLAFGPSSPPFVANLEGASFVFPVVIATNDSLEEAKGRKGHSAIGCLPSDASLLSSVSAPFECFLSWNSQSGSELGSPSSLFHVAPRFVPEAGHYACIVTRQRSAAVTPLGAFDSGPAHLVVRAGWVVDGKNLEASTSAEFLASFSVVEEALQLSNYDRPSAVLTIRVPSHLSSDLVVEVASGDAIHLKELHSPPADERKAITAAGSKGAKWIQVTLNEASPTLRSGDSAEIVVQSTRTGQIVRVPVRIRIVAESVKKAYRELSSAGFIDFASAMIKYIGGHAPSVIAVLAALALAVAVWYHNKASKVRYGTASHAHNSSAFMSDPPPIDRTMSPSLDWSNSVPNYSPPFSSTPRDGFKRFTSPTSPSYKSGQLFSTGEAGDAFRRRGGRYE